MKIHEYQAKALLARYGVPVPRSLLVAAAEGAAESARSLGAGPWVVKAQIHAGGRGKGGGVKVARSAGELAAACRGILGMNLVTHQTGPAGQRVRKVLIEEGLRIERELYLGLVLDRRREKPVVMASARGGMEIEEVAAREPEAILFEEVDPALGLHPFQGRRLAARLGLGNAAIAPFAKLACDAARAFLAEDCSILEINPLVLDAGGALVALDAKINFDDNALYRHPGNAGLRDLDEENRLETRAAANEISYIKMDGNIGCMVNGAGLAMATMDIIKLHGGEPANFLDVGGSATAARVAEAFRIILEDPAVHAILVNIFGGIVRCDLIANGVVEAAREIDLAVPLVVRLAGNKVDEGKQILAASGLDIIAAATLEDAAKRAVAAAAKKGARRG
ncbi:MAG: ADP-forming succinate--CoA ligase subunit beta [Planctomycetes bacterium]|nr:ADP-forming succinate--CoA ligase subunit beta [Planctomycetota bacterium]